MLELLLAKMFNIVSFTQTLLKRGADHPLDAIGVIAAPIAFAAVIIGQMFFRYAAPTVPGRSSNRAVTISDTGDRGH
jgi:hypothetical protein